MLPVPLCCCADGSVVSIIGRLMLMLQYCGFAAKVVVKDPESAIGIGNEVLQAVEERKASVANLVCDCLEDNDIGEARVLDEIHLMEEGVGVENEVVVSIELAILEAIRV